jgi:hypothetical protein
VKGIVLTPKGKYLFQEIHPSRYGESHRRRNLFLPGKLKAGSTDQRLQGEEQERAHKIILKWAEMESSGKLEEQKETAIEGEFLKDVFGEGLGYKMFSDDEETWNLKAKFSVNGGEADAAIGVFRQGQKNFPSVVIELKGPTVNLDRDKFNGRTAVRQCWDYLDELPECQWGIVCNYVSFRLYHRGHTTRAYEHFALQDLRNIETFRQFYYIFERGGLLSTTLGQRPRAEVLLDDSNKRQREVGNELYEEYHTNRVLLIDHLKNILNKPLDTAIKISQKLLDRIIFVAFCEQRGLLPENSIHRAWSQYSPFEQVTNPKWQNFLKLFNNIDKGNLQFGISPFNGGLFSKDDDVDSLDLDDSWTTFFNRIGTYDFRYEVNVDVLGHLFERSVNDIERITQSGFFEAKSEVEQPKMEKSAERKRFGIYYTPPEFTAFITDNTIGKVIDERFADIAKKHDIKLTDAEFGKPSNKLAQFWTECLSTLREIKIVDPACGSGAFLIQAYYLLEERYHDVITQIAHHSQKAVEELVEEIPNFILHENLFGVDLSPEAVEITQLALWIRSAQKGKTLTDLSKNIVCGNSLVEDAAVHPRAMKWEHVFPAIFNRKNRGFDCVIGNPPWERMKVQEREFFDAAGKPEIGAAVNAATRRKLIEKLEKQDPELYQRYLAAKDAAEKTLDYVRTCGRYELTGKGDINTYAVFAELAKNIVADNGQVGLLVPSGIATDHTTKEFFSELTQTQRLMGLYDFENKAPIFPDVHRSFKFCVLLFGGAKQKSEEAEFAFFAREVEELKDKKRRIVLSAKDFKLLNPNTRTCPIFRSRKDAELTKAIYRRVPVLVDESRKEGGNPWSIRFFTMFHQTNDAELFKDAGELKKAGFKLDGNIWKKGKQIFLPLYEAKMVQIYDHRAAGVVVNAENWMRQGQTDETSAVQHQNPEFTVEPRWWVDSKNIINVLGDQSQSAYISYKDVTSATNMRTMIAAFIPFVGVLNSAPLMLVGKKISEKRQTCLLANLNSFAMDFVARQKVGGVHLNFFIVEQLPVFVPDFYSEKCAWDKKQTLEKWISERVLKLTCTSNDMRPLAKAAEFKEGVHKWKEDERSELMAELDAAYFLLYGIKREDVEYILSTFSGTQAEEKSIFKSGWPFERILRHYDILKK